MRAAAVFRHIRRHWPVCRPLRAQAVPTPAVWPEWLTRVFLTVTRFLQFGAPRTNAHGSSIKSAMGMLVRGYQDRPVSATVRIGYSWNDMKTKGLPGMRVAINAAEFAARLREKCMKEKLSIRQAATAAGVSPATFSRVLRGDHIPDYGILVVLAQWAGIPLEDVAIGHVVASNLRLPGEVTTPETVAHVLRADSSLSTKDVETLMASFRVVYDRLRKLNQGQGNLDPEASRVNSQ
jgi:transcriptional regulator with XRE-family HTH domain